MSNVINKAALLEWLDVSVEGVPCKYISIDLLREEIESGTFDIPTDKPSVDVDVKEIKGGQPE